jgi:hypothetical protein
MRPKYRFLVSVSMRQSEEKVGLFLSLTRVEMEITKNKDLWHAAEAAF